jgi:hypothetical protein
LKKAWGTPEERLVEEIEIIDIRPKDDLKATWRPFLHSHDDGIHASFYDSNLAKHPRRSCEALWEHAEQARFVEGTNFPENMDFGSLYDWIAPRIAAEQRLYEHTI